MSSPADHPTPGVGHDPAIAARVEQLYANHADLVRSVCRSLIRDRVEAADAVQQTFLSAQQALANGTSPRDGAAWLTTIARHECLARMRARMREPLPIELGAADAVPDAHTAVVRRREVDELRKALAELPAHQRDAILLREVRGLSYEEVASELSITTSAVESLLFRARRSLQTRLRVALAAFSPGWVPSLRELVLRIVGGDAAAPPAAKLGAVGVATALFAGGALAPTVIGLGHAPNSVGLGHTPTLREHAARSAAAHPTVQAAHPDARVWFRRVPATIIVRRVPPHPNGVSDTRRIVRTTRSTGRSGAEGSTAAGVQQSDGGDGRPSSSATSASIDESRKTDEGDGSDDSPSPTTTTDSTTAPTTTTGTTTPAVTTTDD